MKSIKLLAINALTLIIGIGLMSGSVSKRSAEAARFEKIPAISVTKLGNYRGQYLTVLYAVGSKPFLTTSKAQVSITQIKESRTFLITSDSQALPEVQVEKEGFRPSYNMIVFVISNQSNYSWINADDTVPQGGTKTMNNQESLVETINKTEVDSFISANGIGAILKIDLLN
jgi:hypothetical protein